MIVEQGLWTLQHDWTGSFAKELSRSADLVLVFGTTALLRDADHLREITDAYPNSYVVGCSTAGEICDTQVLDDSLVVTAVDFERTTVRAAEIDISTTADSYDAGRRLAGLLDPAGLVHALVISEGLKVNGSELVKGLVSGLPQNVAVTGGLSGDGARFAETLVCAGGTCTAGRVAAVGFYGHGLKVGYASMGGWDSFGPYRLVTKSKANVLYELDGQSALQLYKSYLGEHAAGLPASGLLFPLSLKAKEGERDGVVRTILSVDEKDQSLTFAGDIPEGSYTRLMRANFERLIDGASGAARVIRETSPKMEADLGILISCVGRKLVLKQRIEEEVEAVRDILGPQATMTGFYSYGEISPFTATAKCELHNQTMTITTFSER